MNQPNSLWEQYEGKAHAELLRGAGCFPVQEYPVALEPPFESFYHRDLTTWDCFCNDWEYAFATGFLGRLVRGPRLYRLNDPLVLPPAVAPADLDQLVAITVEQFPEDESTIAKAEQFLRSLTSLRRPVSFEIVGMGEYPRYDAKIVQQIADTYRRGDRSRSLSEAICGHDQPYSLVQIVVHRRDARQIESQLLVQYPNSAVSIRNEIAFSYGGNGVSDATDGDAYGSTLGLTTAHCFPLRVFTRLDADPLGVAIAAFEQLGKRDWGVLQVLFTPARQEWADVAGQAARDPYKQEKYLFRDIDARLLHEKFSAPLFAVAIRLLAKRRYVYDQLTGWAAQFAEPPQEFAGRPDDTTETLPCAVVARNSYRPGLLLSARELAGLVHLPAPSIASERLRAVKTRTRPAPVAPAEQGSVVLGTNEHRGKRVRARIADELRRRHVYVAGQTGTGKSTLLLNMIVQDINAGRGVGLIDPHGDLVGDVLARVPKRRVEDVVYFNPTDAAFPPGFNPLLWKDEDEREKLVIEALATLQRLSTSPWGSRFEHIFRCTLQTLLQFRNPTLADVPRLLIDAVFRHRVVAKLKSPELLSFWEHEFPKLPKGACDPILNRLSILLLNRRIRNIICQRKGRFDFDRIINGRQIFLANLASGLLTDEVTGIFGTFLMAKFLAATFRRAGVPRDGRIPFYLYVDEFQNFMQASIGFDKVLSEARKYGLVLAGLANQFVAQLSREMRASIIGNVGTLVCFRLGTSDAKLLQDEFGAFSAEEILSLERGQALARVGGIESAFNLETYPSPPVASENMTGWIIGHTRRRFANPRAEVEAALRRYRSDVETTHSARRAQQAPKQKATPTEPREEEWSPWSDFVS